MTNGSFFEQLFPQSEYRRGKKRESGTPPSTLLTALAPISAINTTEKSALINRIQDEIDLIFETLLPDKNWDHDTKDTILSEIITELGV